VWLLYLGRLIDGASGASVSVAQAAVSDIAAPDQRARLFGLLGAAFGLGFVGGPALAGAAAAIGGPRLPFYVAAALAGINALTAVRRLPETRPPESRTPVEPRPATGTGTVRLVAPLIALAFVTLVAFSGFEATFALFGKQRLHLTIASTGAVFAAIGVCIVAVQVGLVHPMVKRLGEAGTIRAGLLANAVGLVVLAAVHGFALLVPAMLLLTVGQGLLSPTLSSAVVGRIGPERRGEVLGLQQAAGGLARVVGPIAGGVLFETAGVASPYLAGAGLMLAAGLLLLPRAGFGSGGGELRHQDVTVQ
jgi:MFS family permease